MRKTIFILSILLTFSALADNCIKSQFMRNKFCIGDLIQEGDQADGFFGEVVGILRNKNYKHMVYVLRIPFWPMTRGFHMKSFPEVVTENLRDITKLNLSKRNKFMKRRWIEYKQAHKAEILKEIKEYEAKLRKRKIKYDTGAMKFN
ncbi:MAG: hypothetical protein E2O68_04500 [Deltaproteobacteria bacterium]|nr:MAG: hypothetical protein E2O68_04500 [Deltaproteobacteria bacterium]